MATDTISRTPASRQQAPRRADPRTRPVTAPRHTRPVSAPETRPAPRTAAPRSRSRAPRMPFILLLVGLLGGALVSLLMISTTLAQGSFRITNLQEQNAELARQAQSLTNQVAQAGNPTIYRAKGCDACGGSGYRGRTGIYELLESTFFSVSWRMSSSTRSSS